MYGFIIVWVHVLDPICTLYSRKRLKFLLGHWLHLSYTTPLFYLHQSGQRCQHLSGTAEALLRGKRVPETDSWQQTKWKWRIRLCKHYFISITFSVLMHFFFVIFFEMGWFLYVRRFGCPNWFFSVILWRLL